MFVDCIQSETGPLPVLHRLESAKHGLHERLQDRNGRGDAIGVLSKIQSVSLQTDSAVIGFDDARSLGNSQAVCSVINAQWYVSDGLVVVVADGVSRDSQWRVETNGNETDHHTAVSSLQSCASPWAAP